MIHLSPEQIAQFRRDGFLIVDKIIEPEAAAAIRDRFAPPKDMAREQVQAKYDLVFRHDRVGRLLDAQEFEHLRFPRHRFSDGLLSQLLREPTPTIGLPVRGRPLPDLEPMPAPPEQPVIERPRVVPVTRSCR